ncbi:hypothetical protein ONA23_03695 [Mycoplasmopsis cynos]|uniref:ribonuclease III domain-containing protein n=1 Tax=Mycoplasmopsis cynos TaxID=171284 RepID=UPI00220DD0AA|nr:ribonuclease III domain-containing protein [Mycoplasmopsis cynos]UWV93612.1 hypothetical protein NW062_06940 [Mycoplasmopsis cynos]WAM06117.1 hypothetical protein ONA23_03695 [Mycoplasmopsis cynos]
MSSYESKILEFLKKEKIIPKKLEYFYQATTHKSFNRNDTKAYNYERLEFLGDAILSFIVSAHIFKKINEASQGELTRYRSSIVQTETLSELSKKLGLIKLLRTDPVKCIMK